MLNSRAVPAGIVYGWLGLQRSRVYPEKDQGPPLSVVDDFKSVGTQVFPIHLPKENIDYVLQTVLYIPSGSQNLGGATCRIRHQLSFHTYFQQLTITPEANQSSDWFTSSNINKYTMFITCLHNLIVIIYGEHNTCRLQCWSLSVHYWILIKRKCILFSVHPNLRKVCDV